MPHVNFQRMTASAVGRNWRSATPEQQKRLQEEFKILLVRTYAGALTQVKDQTVQLKPMRANPERHRGGGAHRGQGQGRADPARLPAREDAATAGRSTTSTCSACGWSSSTARSFSAGDQRRRHRRPDRQAGRAQQGRAEELNEAAADADAATVPRRPWTRCDADAAAQPGRAGHRRVGADGLRHRRAGAAASGRRLAQAGRPRLRGARRAAQAGAAGAAVRRGRAAGPGPGA